MNAILVGVVTGLVTTLLTSLIYSIIRRFRFRPKSEEKMDEIKEQLETLNTGQHLLFKLVLPLLLRARDGKTNGELKEALRLYNEYMQEK